MSEEDRVDPYTPEAGERLEHGVSNACKGLAIDVAEVRESIDDELVSEILQQAEYCLNRAGDRWTDRRQQEGKFP